MNVRGIEGDGGVRKINSEGVSPIDDFEEVVFFTVEDEFSLQAYLSLRIL